MNGSEQNKAGRRLSQEEAFRDCVIDISPVLLVLLWFLFEQVVYDLLFCLQEPLPEYPRLFHIHRVAAFTRQTLVNMPYAATMFALLLPARNKAEYTVEDYGALKRKPLWWLALAASVALVCFVPVLRIDDAAIAWGYRIAYLAGTLLLVAAGYAVIRLAFRSKLSRTHSPARHHFTGLLTVCAVLTVVLTVVLHRMILPASVLG